MAPEQDDPLALVDTRTDVYGLGRLGQRLLGRTPSGSRTAGCARMFRRGSATCSGPPRSAGPATGTGTPRRSGRLSTGRWRRPGRGAVRRRGRRPLGWWRSRPCWSRRWPRTRSLGRGPARAPDRVAGPAPPTTAAPSTGWAVDARRRRSPRRPGRPSCHPRLVGPDGDPEPPARRYADQPRRRPSPVLRRRRSGRGGRAGHRAGATGPDVLHGGRRAPPQEHRAGYGHRRAEGAVRLDGLRGRPCTTYSSCGREPSR